MGTFSIKNEWQGSKVVLLAAVLGIVSASCGESPSSLVQVPTTEGISTAGISLVETTSFMAEPILPVTLPETVEFDLAFPGDAGPASYFDITVTSGSPTDDLNGFYPNSWCIDTDRPIAPGTFTANVYSSYDPNLPVGLIEFPENLPLVNYIINQNYAGQPSEGGFGNFTAGDVQRTIWGLLDDEQSGGLGPVGNFNPNRVNQILADAQQNGVGFVPSIGQEVAVILEPFTLAGEPQQVLIIGVESQEPVISPFSCPAQDVIDFAGLSNGEVLDDQFADLGITFSAFSNKKSTHSALIFDTDLDNTADPDLEQNVGNVMIIAENLKDRDNDGLIDSPDDNARGGSITVMFDQPFFVESFLALDLERAGSQVIAFDAEGSEILRTDLPRTGDSQNEEVELNVGGVSKLMFQYRDSGAFTNLLFCPEP